MARGSELKMILCPYFWKI